MDKDKSEVFKSFTNKAIKRFQEKKVRKYRTLHIPSLDELKSATWIIRKS